MTDAVGDELRWKLDAADIEGLCPNSYHVRVADASGDVHPPAESETTSRRTDPFAAGVSLWYKSA